MSDEKKEGQNEAVKAMGDAFKPDVPAGLATIPKGVSAHAIARRTIGEIVKNECEFVCMSCGWNKTLKFDEEEMAVLDNNVREYTGPCPGTLQDGSRCNMMTLVPKDAFWGKDFPSMADSAMKQKRDEAKVQADAMVDAVVEKVGPMIGGAMSVPKPKTDDAPSSVNREDLPAEPDLSKLTPR